MAEITGQPAYEQVADDLRKKIADGTYSIGQSIPPTTQLMETYGVSITVVRAAVKELQTEGVLIGQPGKGVYVRSAPDPSARRADSDVVRRLEELDETVQHLAQQFGILQGQVIDLYGKVGQPYPHESAQKRPPKDRANRIA